LGAIEGSRFNSFAFWRGIEAKVAGLLPQRQVMTKVMAEPPKVPADNVEAAQ
jgi:hypothetical protein